MYFSQQLILQEVFISKIPEIIDRGESEPKKIVLTDIFIYDWKKKPFRKTVNFIHGFYIPFIIVEVTRLNKRFCFLSALSFKGATSPLSSSVSVYVNALVIGYLGRLAFTA